MKTLRIGSIVQHLGNKFEVVKLNTEPVTDSKGYLIGEKYSDVYFKVKLIELGDKPKRGDKVGNIWNFTNEQIEKGWVIIL